MINVDKREWMIALRNALGIERAKMARACKCSDYLLEIMEEASAITTPGAASRIARCYGMDVHQYNQLVHPDRRARVLPVWKDPPVDRKFCWTTYYNEHVCREVEAI